MESPRPVKQLVFNFGRKGKKNFIQEANRRSRLKGNVGKFGNWCRSQGLGKKVTLRCINKAKRSGNVKLIKRATYAKNIGGYVGAKHKRTTRFGRPRFVKSIPRNRVARSVMQPVKKVTFKNKRVSKYNFNFSPREMDYINNHRLNLEREIKFLETINLMTLQKTLHVLQTTTPKEVLNNDVRTRIDMKLYAAIIDHKLDIEEGEEVSSYPSPGADKLFTLRVKKVAKRTSRFGNIMDPASYYHLINIYNDELRTNNKYTRGRYQARYRYYQNMLNDTFSHRVIPINYLVQSVDALNVNTTLNKIKRYVLIRRILKIIRENMHDQEATRIANRTREPLPTNLLRNRNNFGKKRRTRFGNNAGDDYINDLLKQNEKLTYKISNYQHLSPRQQQQTLEQQREAILPAIEQELILAEEIIDSYPENHPEKKKAKGLLTRALHKVGKVVTVENTTSFIDNSVSLLNSLTNLYITIGNMSDAYNGTYDKSSTFRGITSPLSSFIQKMKPQQEQYRDSLDEIKSGLAPKQHYQDRRNNAIMSRQEEEYDEYLNNGGRPYGNRLPYGYRDFQIPPERNFPRQQVPRQQVPRQTVQIGPLNKRRKIV